MTGLTQGLKSRIFDLDTKDRLDALSLTTKSIIPSFLTPKSKPKIGDNEVSDDEYAILQKLFEFDKYNDRRVIVNGEDTSVTNYEKLTFQQKINDFSVGDFQDLIKSNSLSGSQQRKVIGILKDAKADATLGTLSDIFSPSLFDDALAQSTKSGGSVLPSQ